MHDYMELQKHLVTIFNSGCVFALENLMNLKSHLDTEKVMNCMLLQHVMLTAKAEISLLMVITEASVLRSSSRVTAGVADLTFDIHVYICTISFCTMYDAAGSQAMACAYQA